MSRIEKAIERAAQLRQGAVAAQSGPPAKPAKEGFKIHIAPPVSEEGVKILSDNPLLVTLNDSRSPVAEEYRKMKSLLVKMTSGEEFRNTLLVTSSIPGEGKSITALNLAISMSQEYDHTVLLVDADLRRPSIHTYLNIENKIGLSDCLANTVDISQAILATGIGKLSIITAGSEVSNPSELFSSNRMKDLLDEMKGRYHDRYIIFDTPPLLPFAETLSLSHLVDGVVFVVKEQMATQANVKDSLEVLKGCNVLGIVYNDASIVENVERYYAYRSYQVLAKNAGGA